jgi:hypothetical protein
MSQPPNQTSFRRGISGNPGGRPATAEVSALARRYTADWVRGLVGVVRLPVCKENASHIVSAAIALRDTGYPGLKSASAESGGATSLHLHLLAVTKDAQATLQSLPQGSVVEGVAWEAELHEPPLEDEYVPPPDERLPHEALPLWDAVPADPRLGADDNENQAGRENEDGNDISGD